MKESFDSVEIEFHRFEETDIIASSTCQLQSPSCDYELPIITTKP